MTIDHVKILRTALVLLAVSLIGLVLVPLLYPFRRGDHYRLAWWDNPKGIYTAPGYLPRFIKPRTFWDAYYWTALRNPARGFSLSLGYNTSDIEKIDVIKPGEFGKSDITIVVLAGGKSYPMIYQYREFGGWYWQLKYGWKQWNMVDTWPEPGKTVSFVCYPQIRKRRQPQAAVQGSSQ